MRNKNTLKQSLLLAVLLPFLAFSVVLANHGAEEEEVHMDSSASAGAKAKVELRQETKVELKEAREANQEERKETRKDNMAGRRAMMATRIKNMMEGQIARATKALDRLSLILDKIEAKSKEMPAGSDMTQVNASIAKAKTQEAAIKVAIEKSHTGFEVLAETKVEDTSDDEPSTSQPVKAAKQAVTTYMTSIRDVKRRLIEFHKTLQETVKLMRAAAKVEASTETTTPNN